MIKIKAIFTYYITYRLKLKLVFYSQVQSRKKLKVEKTHLSLYIFYYKLNEESGFQLRKTILK